MKYSMHVIAAAFILSLLSAGCYTQLASRGDSRDQYEDEEEYAGSDTSGASDINVNNYYFGDDEYRHNRFNLSFGYYHPGRWSYYSPIYDPWFDDPWYWPMGWRPYVMYPYPTWSPYGSYYGNDYYWGYYNHPHHDSWYSGTVGEGGRGVPNRPRLVGTTRGDEPRGIRSRTPLVTPSGSVTTTGSAAPGIRTRATSEESRQPSVGQPAGNTGTTTTRTRGNDTPWWERAKQEAKSSSQTEAATTRGTSQQPAGTAGRRSRQVEQAPNSQSAPGTSSTPAASESPKQGRRERKSDGQTRQQNVAPPSQQSQPRYSPPANSGGSRERSGGSSSGGSSSGRSSSGSGSSSGGSSRTRSDR